MTRHLFIGGPADGEWRDVEHACEVWRVAEIPARPDPFTLPIASQLLTFREHRYIRRYWKDYDSKRLHKFYVHEDIQPRDVFAMLIAGYRQPK